MGASSTLSSLQEGWAGREHDAPDVCTVYLLAPRCLVAVDGMGAGTKCCCLHNPVLDLRVRVPSIMHLPMCRSYSVIFDAVYNSIELLEGMVATVPSLHCIDCMHFSHRMLQASASPSPT